MNNKNMRKKGSGIAVAEWTGALLAISLLIFAGIKLGVMQKGSMNPLGIFFQSQSDEKCPSPAVWTPKIKEKIDNEKFTEAVKEIDAFKECYKKEPVLEYYNLLALAEWYAIQNNVDKTINVLGQLAESAKDNGLREDARYLRQFLAIYYGKENSEVAYKQINNNLLKDIKNFFIAERHYNLAVENWIDKESIENIRLAAKYYGFIMQDKFKKGHYSEISAFSDMRSLPNNGILQITDLLNKNDLYSKDTGKLLTRYILQKDDFKNNQWVLPSTYFINNFEKSKLNMITLEMERVYLFTLKYLRYQNPEYVKKLEWYKGKLEAFSSLDFGREINEIIKFRLLEAQYLTINPLSVNGDNDLNNLIMSLDNVSWSEAIQRHVNELKYLLYLDLYDSNNAVMALKSIDDKYKYNLLIKATQALGEKELKENFDSLSKMQLTVLSLALIEKKYNQLDEGNNFVGAKMLILTSDLDSIKEGIILQDN